MADVSGKRSLGQRENQEDAFAILAQSEEDASSDLLMVVSDGMGGHIGGEVASNLVIKTFQTHFVSGSTAQNPRDRLLESAHAGNAALATRIEADPSLKGMGCTLVGALKLNDKLIWVSIGDSHVYLYRAGSLKHLNADHSVFGELMELVKAGKITQAEADAHPRRNALRSAVIGTELALIDINAVDLQHGDLIILATDGLDSLSNDKVAALLADSARAEAKIIANQLLEAVEGAGRSKQDNTTVVVYRHSETNRSTWSPDSKWGWNLSSKTGSPTSFRKAGLLIAGLFVLAGLIVLLAFRGTPVVKPEPSPQTTEQTETAPTIPRDEAIGGGEVVIPTPQPSGDGSTIEGGGSEAVPAETPADPNTEEGSNGDNDNGNDATIEDPNASTDARSDAPVDLGQ